MGNNEDAEQCLLSLCNQGLTRNLKVANSRKRHIHSVPYTLHIENNKEKNKTCKKGCSLGRILSVNPYLSTEYYTHSAMTLHLKYTILFKHPEEICSGSPWTSWGLPAGELHESVINAESYLFTMNPKLISNCPRLDRFRQNWSNCPLSVFPDQESPGLSHPGLL